MDHGRRSRTGVMKSASPLAGLLTALSLSAACSEAPSGGPTPVERAVQPVTVTQDAGVAAPDASGAIICNAFADDDGVRNHPEYAYQLGWMIAVIRPRAAPRGMRERLEQSEPSHMTGNVFDADILDVVARPGIRTDIAIEVHQWDAVVYNDREEPMEPANGLPGHAAPAAGRRMLVMLAPDGLLGRGWHLVHSWALRDDGALDERALRLEGGANVSLALADLRRQLTRGAAPEPSLVTDSGDSGVGGVLP